MWMDGCEEWQQLCDVVPDWPLCVSGGRSGSEEVLPPPQFRIVLVPSARPMLMHSLPVPQIPTMKMYFHASILDYVLFKVLL
mgnify:CR=1 FL=1